MFTFENRSGLLRVDTLRAEPMRPISEPRRAACPRRLSAPSRPLDGARAIGLGSPLNFALNGLWCWMHATLDGRPILDSIAELMDAMLTHLSGRRLASVSTRAPRSLH